MGRRGWRAREGEAGWGGKICSKVAVACCSCIVQGSVQTKTRKHTLHPLFQPLPRSSSQKDIWLTYAKREQGRRRERERERAKHKERHGTMQMHLICLFFSSLSISLWEATQVESTQNSVSTQLELALSLSAFYVPFTAALCVHVCVALLHYPLSLTLSHSVSLSLSHALFVPVPVPVPHPQ